MLDPGDYGGTYEANAGHLALDYANTISNRNNDKAHDWLDSYRNLISWGELVGILSDSEARILQRESERRPEVANEALGRAINLRETSYRIFSAATGGRAPEVADIESLNSLLIKTMVHLQVVQEEGIFTWKWANGERDLNRIIWPVTRAAADLLTSETLGRVGECLGEGCGWLFLDMSKNRSRRWCSMEECGNRAKARRHYARTLKS